METKGDHPTDAFQSTSSTSTETNVLANKTGDLVDKPKNSMTQDKGPTPKAKYPPFELNGRLVDSMCFRTVSLNMNGMLGTDFRRRVMCLKRMMNHWVNKDGVVLVNLQEVTNHHMNAENVRSLLLSGLPSSWTGTGMIGRHGDSKTCLGLMTLWNADVLHLDSLQNFHFSTNGKVGDQLAAPMGIMGTGNALIMEFSLTVPEPSLTLSEENKSIDVSSTKESDSIKIPLHSGGKSVDVIRSFVNVNVHLPTQCDLRCCSLHRLEVALSKVRGPSSILHMAGDMNLYGDQPDHGRMIEQLLRFGTITCADQPMPSDLSEAKFSYPSHDGERQRRTTYLGTQEDLKRVMKIDVATQYDQYCVWMDGDADDILKACGRKVLPLDLVIFGALDPSWSATSMVMDTLDMAKLDASHFIPWFKKCAIGTPDLGNYLSDHLPVITLVEFKRQE